MLLVIDIGNSHTVLGIYKGDELIEHWRLATTRQRTSDEYGILLRQLFASATIPMDTVRGCILSSVVPPMQPILTEMVNKHCGIAPLVVGPGIKTGIAIRYENPREVGADRIVNAVAAFERFGEPVIVVDFGTATTFDAISAHGDYLGGAICPGISISAEALFQRASKLPRVEISKPPRVIGRNTVHSIQSGLVHGYVGLIEGMVHRIEQEYGHSMRVIATGGLSALFAQESDRIDAVDPDLTLNGLRILYERNAATDDQD